MGRYGSTTIADVTVRDDGSLAPLHGFSALSTVEANPTKRLMLYFNYGGDYIDREYWVTGTGTAEGYGVPGTFTNAPVMSGCNTQSATVSGTSSYNAGTGTCAANNKDVQELPWATGITSTPAPRDAFASGLQYSLVWRDLWSGSAGTANPGAGARATEHVLHLVPLLHAVNSSCGLRPKHKGRSAVRAALLS